MMKNQWFDSIVVFTRTDRKAGRQAGKAGCREMCSLGEQAMRMNACMYG